MANPETLSIDIKKSDRAKNLRITVSPDGVLVTAPGCLSEKDQLQKPRGFVTGDTLPFRGEVLTLRVLEYDKKHTKIIIRDHTLEVHINRNTPQEHRPEAIRRHLTQWYKAMAKATFIEIADFHKTRLGLDYQTLRVKNQKTRWGSCSKKGNLNFNWQLVMAPIDIIDYVVVHELCHLVHLNHGQEFWRLVESQLPDYLISKDWLRKNGISLRL